MLNSGSDPSQTQTIWTGHTIDLGPYVGPDPAVVDEDGNPAGASLPVRVLRRTLWWWLGLRRRSVHRVRMAPTWWWAFSRVAPLAVAGFAGVFVRWLWVSEVRMMQRRSAIGPAPGERTSTQATDLMWHRHQQTLLRLRALRFAEVAVVLAAGYVGLVVAVDRWPGWCAAVGAAALVAGPPLLGALVVSPGEVITSPEPQVDERPTGEVVAAWFEFAGITPKGLPAVLDGDPVRDVEAGGTVIRIWLPRGVTTGKVRAQWRELASAVQVNSRRLHLDDLDDSGHAENLIELFIADLDPAQTPPPPWPLAGLHEWDVFKPFVIGWDARRRPVRVGLMWAHHLVAGLMTKGKTSAMRALVLAGVMDPRVILDVFNLKGSADWEPFRARAAVYEDDRRTIVPRLVEYLRRLDGEVADRFDVLKQRYGVSRVTPELARVVRPRIVVIDEIHLALEDPTHGATVLQLLQDIARLAPQCGVILIVSTQKPDRKALPPALRSLFSVRVALSVQTWQDSEAVLGEAPGRRGLDASDLGGWPGVAAVVADAAEGVAPVGEVVTLAHVSAVVAAGVLAGLAGQREVPAGVPAGGEPPAGGVVGLVLGVWPEGADRMHTSVLAGLVGLDQGVLRDRLAEVGVVQRDHVAVARRNARGYLLVDVRGV